MWAWSNPDGNCGLTLGKVQGNHNRELLIGALGACPVPAHPSSPHALGAQPAGLGGDLS